MEFVLNARDDTRDTTIAQIRANCLDFTDWSRSLLGIAAAYDVINNSGPNWDGNAAKTSELSRSGGR